MKQLMTKQFGVAAFVTLVLFTSPLFAATTDTTDITPQLVSAGVNLDGLRAIEVGGIVVLRGRAINRAAAENAGAIALSLGYKRVANLIVVIEPADDIAIERLAERQLGQQRSLDGCQFHIDSDNGVVHLGGTVQYELQKDIALQIVRNLNGVRSVQNEMKK
jgi:osmotically-inducible protein OsmY